MPQANHRVITTVLYATAMKKGVRYLFSLTGRVRIAPDGNPVVDLMPQANRRVITTVLHHATRCHACHLPRQQLSFYPDERIIASQYPRDIRRSAQRSAVG